jgi:hypothetical protein
LTSAGAALDAGPEVGLKHHRLDGSDLETTKAAHEALLSAYARVADELSLFKSRRDLMERLSHVPTVVIDTPFPLSFATWSSPTRGDSCESSERCTRACGMDKHRRRSQRRPVEPG